MRGKRETLYFCPSGTFANLKLSCDSLTFHTLRLALQKPLMLCKSFHISVVNNEQ